MPPFRPALWIAEQEEIGTRARGGSKHGPEIAVRDPFDGTAADALATLSSLLGACALVGIWWLFARGPATVERLVRYSAASVVAGTTP